MKTRFAIMKRSPMWIVISILLISISWFLFFTNSRYSEEFTGWVSLWIEWNLDLDNEKINIENYLTQKEYQNIDVSL